MTAQIEVYFQSSQEHANREMAMGQAIYNRRYGDKTATQIVPRRARNPSPEIFVYVECCGSGGDTSQRPALSSRALSVSGKLRRYVLLRRQVFLAPPLAFRSFFFFFFQRYHPSSNLLSLCIDLWFL